MQKIPLDKAAPGMVLAKPVESDTGQTLVAQGTEVSEELIDRLERFQIKRITVEGRPVAMPGERLPDPEKIQLEMDRAFIRVQDNPGMMRLKEMILRHRQHYATRLLAEIRAAEAAERAKAAVEVAPEEQGGAEEPEAPEGSDAN